MTHSFCKEFLQGLLIHLDAEGGLNVIELMRRIFERGTKARMLSQANHRYALNYINALNYLESLRRHNDYCDFEKVLFLLLNYVNLIQSVNLLKKGRLNLDDIMYSVVTLVMLRT